MKLFYSKGACSLAPHIALCEAGLKYELEPVNLKTKHYRGGNYLDVNAKGYVPALQLDDGQLLTEAAVILEYIADQKPEKNLMPKTGMPRYRAQEWLNYVASEVHKGFGPLWHPAMPAEAKELALQNLKNRFTYLNQRVETGYLMGQDYCVADGYLFTVLNWTNMLKIDLGPWPQLKAYFDRVGARPGTKAALAAEGLA